MIKLTTFLFIDPKNYSLTALKTDRSESYEPLFGSKENNVGSIENDIDRYVIYDLGEYDNYSVYRMLL